MHILRVVEHSLKSLVEINLYGVCTRLANSWGIASSTVRKYFIYTSIITFGSSVVMYLIIHFWYNILNYTQQKKSQIRDM